jgi:hypothetical protein
MSEQRTTFGALKLPWFGLNWWQKVVLSIHFSHRFSSLLAKIDWLSILSG